MLEKAKTFILDTLFPIFCLACGKENVWLCEKCLKKIQPLSFQVCPHCEKIITDSGRVCSYCKKSPAFKINLDGLIAAAKYKEKGLDKLVHLYKYNFIESLSAPLGEIMIKAILHHNQTLPDMIVPVPLHKRRFRWRGFNQAELLAEYISRNLAPGMEIPVSNNLLIRQKYTPPQMTVKKYAKRRKNISGAFALNLEGSTLDRLKVEPSLKNRGELKNKVILLVDDIATTGATLNECAKVLKQHGAKKVFAVVLARQEISKKSVTRHATEKNYN